MKDWVPLLQSLAWIGLIVYAITKFSIHIESLFEAIKTRVQTGSSLKAGPIELGEDLKALEKVSASSTASPEPEGDWSKERNDIYGNNERLFMAHVIEPTKKRGQLFDIFIFLVRHKSKDMSDVEYAEFFLGKYWGNKVFRGVEKDGMIGISTSAYGPFLCICRVKMKDGRMIKLHRYIDFEMDRVFNQLAI